MNNKVMRITNDKGRHFNVRILKQGDRYGRDDCLTVETADKILVEFFDATYEGTTHGPLGQFTCGRYYADTILEGPRLQGLCLHGGEPVWEIDGEAMGIVRDWIHNQTEGEI